MAVYVRKKLDYELEQRIKSIVNGCLTKVNVAWTGCVFG